MPCLLIGVPLVEKECIGISIPVSRIPRITIPRVSKKVTMINIYGFITIEDNILTARPSACIISLVRALYKILVEN